MSVSVAPGVRELHDAETAQLPLSLSRWATIAFWASFALVAILGLALALGNNLPGHWDAINNLATARNLAEGRGFVSDVVQQLAVPETLPGRESVRAPGVPFVMAAVFRIAGVSYAAPVIVALLAVLLTALCLRQAVREMGGGRAADLLGALVLLTHRTFELRSIWNNGFLALLTAFMLLLLVRHVNGRLAGWKFAIACAFVTAFGFLMKQTFMLGAIPFAVGLLVTDGERRIGTRIAQAAAFLALFAVLTAPYWLTNLVEHGQALYSPIQGLRLPTRYGILGPDRFHRTVRFGAEAYGYGNVVQAIGIGGLLAREVAHWGKLIAAFVLQNPFVVAGAIAGLAAARLRDWRIYAAVLALAIPPVFDSSYWIMEARYLFPLYPLSLFMAWMAIRGWRERWSVGTGASAAGWPLRGRRVVDALATCALLWAGLHGARQWRWELIASRFDGPSWVEPVRALPGDAIVMAGTPPEVNWYTRKVSVIAPVGTHAELQRVLAEYRPTHFLDVEPEMEARRVPFASGELEELASGSTWRLYRITAPLSVPPTSR